MVKYVYTLCVVKSNTDFEVKIFNDELDAYIAGMKVLTELIKEYLKKISNHEEREDINKIWNELHERSYKKITLSLARDYFLLYNTFYHSSAALNNPASVRIEHSMVK